MHHALHGASCASIVFFNQCSINGRDLGIIKGIWIGIKTREIIKVWEIIKEIQYSVCQNGFKK